MAAHPRSRDRRILSLWFSRLSADRAMRRDPMLATRPLVIVGTVGNAQKVHALNAEAAAHGIRKGQPLRDAHAMCDGLVSRERNAPDDAGFLAVLRRWAGKFSPWVAEEGGDGLTVDLTGCAHLFGGEEPLMEIVRQDCADMGLCVRMGLADTPGAAWALARFAGQAPGPDRSGDAIDMEARATRSRAGKRHWTRGGQAPASPVSGAMGLSRAEPGQTYSALAPLPVAALRLDPDTVAQLSRLGLRRVGDLLGQPRASLARRFGKGLVYRLDQAMGSAPEPVSPARPPDHFAIRLTLPEPIGLASDVQAAIDRLLPPLCAALKSRGRVARRVRLEAHRTDHRAEVAEIGLARPSDDPAHIAPLLAMKIDGLDAGYGFDMLRLQATVTEPRQERRPVGHLEAGRAVAERLARNTALDDLLGKLGARVGLDRITRLHPASSHIPEKGWTVQAAAYSSPHEGSWPAPPGPRPLRLWQQPEIVQAPDTPQLPIRFRWRGRDHGVVRAQGPERIAPEWWLDDPAWRSGTRDYWRVTTDRGEQLWLYYAHGGTMSAGWFCHGMFA